MVKLTKIYTKTGDAGTTGLVGGTRINKADCRVGAIGAVDELNALCGLVCAAMSQPALHEWRSRLQQVQQALFNLGAQIATLDPAVKVPVVTAAMVQQLETEIDAMNASLPTLTSFILPGGGEVAARLHVARTVCRRAEQVLWQLAAIESIDAQCLVYLNRLSDWLFVLARVVGNEEILWCQT